MGANVFLGKYQDGKKPIEKLQVERASKIALWLLEKLNKEGEKLSSCSAKKEFNYKDLEELKNLLKENYFTFSKQDKRFSDDLQTAIIFEHPEIIGAIIDGIMTIEEIPEEIVENFIKTRNEFEASEIQKVLGFVTEAFKENLKVEIYASW